MDSAGLEICKKLAWLERQESILLCPGSLLTGLDSQAEAGLPLGAPVPTLASLFSVSQEHL